MKSFSLLRCPRPNPFGLGHASSDSVYASSTCTHDGCLDKVTEVADALTFG